MAETSKSGPENLHTLVSVLWCILCFRRITFLRTYYGLPKGDGLYTSLIQPSPVALAIHGLIHRIMTYVLFVWSQCQTLFHKST